MLKPVTLAEKHSREKRIIFYNDNKNRAKTFFLIATGGQA